MRKARARRVIASDHLGKFLAGEEIAFSIEALRALRDAKWFNRPFPLSSADAERAVALMAKWHAAGQWFGATKAIGRAG